MGGSKRKGQPRTGVCAYCGKHGEISRDHVIPRCVFEGAVPPDIPIVLVCRTCNGVLKGRGDTYLRDVLAPDCATLQHPVAQRAFAAFSRARERGRPPSLAAGIGKPC